MINYFMRFCAVPGITKAIINKVLPTRREAKEPLATVNGGVDDGGELQLATVRGAVTRRRGMERPP